MDLVVVGAGPAGLAAASAARDSGLRFVLLEAGSNATLRNRSNPSDISSGVGGAGLFSDGKFSFKPSATRLWDLTPTGDVDRSLTWLLTYLTDQTWFSQVSTGNTGAQHNPANSHVLDKRYPSFYMSFDDRAELVGRLVSELGSGLRTHSRVLDCSPVDDGWVVTAEAGASSAQWAAPAVVITGGRYGPLEILSEGTAWRPGRLEVGIRLEQASDSFLLAAHPATDPKIIASTTTGWEARTFCCCRDGEVVAVQTGQWLTVAGRADGPPSGRSNVGFLLRPPAEFASEGLALRCLTTGRVLRQSMRELLLGRGDIPAVLGESAAAALNEGVEVIADAAGSRSPIEGTAWGMAVEGIGRYPGLDNTLRWGERPLWVAGDATGLFRGLTAAFVSGYFSGLQAVGWIGGASEAVPAR